MTDAAYVYGGYAATFVVLALYTVRLVRKSRTLAKSLPPEERR